MRLDRIDRNPQLAGDLRIFAIARVSEQTEPHLWPQAPNTAEGGLARRSAERRLGRARWRRLALAERLLEQTGSRRRQGLDRNPGTTSLAGVARAQRGVPLA